MLQAVVERFRILVAHRSDLIMLKKFKNDFGAAIC